MFNRVTIELKGPICDCEEQDLGWFIWRDADNKEGLAIRCRTCQVELKVPNGSFKARIVLGTPYPGKVPADPKTELEVIDGGKVIKIDSKSGEGGVEKS